MTAPRPRTLSQLLLLGFGVVSAPLLVALAAAWLAIDELAGDSHRAVVEAARTMRGARSVVDTLADMERNARQFAVLGDTELRALYQARRADFLAALGELRPLIAGDPRRLQLLDEVAWRELSVHQRVLAEAGDTQSEFDTLAELADRLLAASSRAVADEADRMRLAASRTQERMLAYAVALLPLALVLAGLFTLIIHRPLARLDAAIRRIGAGKLDEDLRITGPRDLEELGDRLDWLRRHLRELESHKTAFLRHMSHELKTPLTSIVEGVDLLRDDRISTGERGEIMTIIDGAARELQHRIEDLLQYSARPTPLAPASVRPVALDELLARVVAAQQLAAAARDLRLQVDAAPATVAGDPELLRITLANLLSNAIKYSPPTGTVHMGLARDGGWVHVDVQDQGPGIEPDERERVFEAFFQGRRSAAGHVKGTGLGLALAREYARQHGGDIRILDSETGARLRVTLPLAPGAG